MHVEKRSRLSSCPLNVHVCIEMMLKRKTCRQSLDLKEDDDGGRVMDFIEMMKGCKAVGTPRRHDSQNPLEVCPVWISQHKETQPVQTAQASACTRGVLFVRIYVSAGSARRLQATVYTRGRRKVPVENAR